MSQFSAPIDYIVEHILPNYSDDDLSEMLVATGSRVTFDWWHTARTNKNTLLYRAILREMGKRCADEA